MNTRQVWKILNPDNWPIWLIVGCMALPAVAP